MASLLIVSANCRLYSVLFCCALLFCSHAVFAAPSSEPNTIALRATAFEHIQFGKIKPNQIVFEKQTLRIDVNESASLLMMSFNAVKPVSEVRFQWQSQGDLLVKSAQHEEQKTGDDAFFKIGLLLESKDIFINPLVPRWVRRVQKSLVCPADKILDLVVGSKHAVGEQWASPYNDKVTMIAISSSAIEDGWNQAVHQFEQPVKVVAIWLMSDGDNTHSTFSTQIKNIQLH